MANGNLKIDDEYVNSQAEQVNEWTQDLQTGIDKYLDILNKILGDAIIEGETAEALECFAFYAENLRNIVKDMGEEAKGMCQSFLMEVDQADSFLY